MAFCRKTIGKYIWKQRNAWIPLFLPNIPNAKPGPTVHSILLKFIENNLICQESLAMKFVPSGFCGWLSSSTWDSGGGNQTGVCVCVCLCLCQRTPGILYHWNTSRHITSSHLYFLDKMLLYCPSGVTGVNHHSQLFWSPGVAYWIGGSASLLSMEGRGMEEA